MINFSAAQPVDWIWDGDPAIDKDSAAHNRELFERTGDMTHLPLKDGSAPRVFKVKRLTRKQFFRVMGLSPTEQIQEAVAFGLVAMNPGDLELARRNTDAGERLNDATLDKLYELGPKVLIDLGSFIIAQARPDPT